MEMTKKEKIIIGILSLIFLVILCLAGWDIYGQKLLNSITVSQTATSQPTNATDSAQLQKKQNQGENKQKPTDTNIAYSSYSQCIENTKDLGSSKDCCDCLAADGSVRKACRDFAATYDYSKNTVIKKFEIPSKLGRSGDYSACTASGDQNSCKQCCESSATGLACGDYQYCRTACNNLAQ